MSDSISNDINDPILKYILKYKDHPNRLFKFSNLEKGEILNEIVYLDASKSCQDTNVSTKIIKENADIFTDFIHLAINASINKNEFPFFLKLEDVIHVFKKCSKNSKHNYRRVSILKNSSKVYERVMFKQIEILWKTFFRNFNVALEKATARSNVLFL